MSGGVISRVLSAEDTATRDISVEAVLTAIRSGGKKLRGQITQIRNRFESELDITGDLQKAKLAVERLKKDLPGVTWSGRFSYRASCNLLQHSGLLCADLDELGEKLLSAREQLQTSPHLFTLSLSPTGYGLKAVFRVRADASKHAGSFRAVARHVRELTGVQIDESGKDVARLCFLSFDPELYHNPNAIELEPLPEPEKPKAAFNSSGEVNLSERQRIAAELLGNIDWQSKTSGYCACPGKHLHTTGDGERDCKIELDGAPTAHCFHDHCRGILEGVNHALRSRIGRAEFVPTRVEAPPRNGEPVELPPPLPPYVPPPLDLLPGVLQDYVHKAAESLNVDVSFILLPLLSALGSAIGNTRSIFLKRDFVQPPVIWTTIVGRSGSRKSPALEKGTFAVMEHERELARQSKQAMEIYENDKGGWESKLKKERGEKPEPPPWQSCMGDDLTLAALAETMELNPRGLLVRRDELSGWYASFDQFTNAKGSDISRWLSLHTAESFAFDRRSEKRHYRLWQPRVSITGGIQPRVLRRVLTEDFFERGLPARFLFAYPPMRQDKWTEAEVSDASRARVLELFGELWLLQPDSDAHGQPRPKLLSLNSDAQAEYVRYYNECGASAVQADEHEEAAWSKLNGYAARLALVGQLLRDPHAETVTGETMRAACALSRWSGNEAVRTYATLTETPEQHTLRRLVEFIQSRGGSVTTREVTQSFRPLKNERDKTEAALKGLESVGLGEWGPTGTTDKGGRPTRKFQLLPLSTSTKPHHLRGKTGGIVDVDTPNSEKNEAPSGADTEAETLAHDESGVARL